VSDASRYSALWDRGPRLNLGCALNHLAGFINIDIDPRAEPDILVGGGPLPFMSGSFNFVMMSQVLEHIRDPFPLMDEVWRVLIPGGHVLIIVPHGMSSTQMGTPSHVVPYIADTFTAFQSERYETPGYHGFGAYEKKQVHPWEIVRIDREAKAGLPSRLPHRLLFALEPYVWNLFENLYCVMRKGGDR
jgi:SAM-dependent methyltransferase